MDIIKCFNAKKKYWLGMLNSFPLGKKILSLLKKYDHLLTEGMGYPSRGVKMIPYSRNKNFGS